MTTPNKVSRPLSLLTPTHLPRSSLAPSTPSSALHHQQSLQETFTVLGELTHEFKNHSDECTLITKLIAKKKEIRQVMEQKNRQMKELIARLTQQVADLTRITSQPPTVGLHQQQQLLQQQKTIISEQIHNLTQEIERLEASGVEVSKQKAALQQQKLDSEAAKAKQMPSMAGTMGLYRNFSSIAWDYDVDSSTTVKGTFHLDRSQAIKPFRFDRNQTSDFDIANQLWSMMEA